MFLLTQFIGLFVIHSTGSALPFGLEPPQEDPTTNFFSIIFAFVLAFFLIFILMKYQWKFIIRAWFFFVVSLALAISINAIIKNYISNTQSITLLIAIPLAYLKIFRPNFLAHNLTELLIYPGIAVVFIPILTTTSIIILLILISIYDMWAVWKSGIMQKMAKFQMEELRVFGGFLVPSVSKKVKNQIKEIKLKYKNKKIPKKEKNRKFKVNLAILGGGDVIFPIITSGVFMASFPKYSLFGIAGLVPALFVTFGSLAGLVYLFAITKKGKAYPAMPYITVGIFASLAIWRLFFF